MNLSNSKFWSNYCGWLVALSYSRTSTGLCACVSAQAVLMLDSGKKAEIRQKNMNKKAVKRMKNKKKEMDQIIALNMIMQKNKKNDACIRKQNSRSNMTSQKKIHINKQATIKRKSDHKSCLRFLKPGATYFDENIIVPHNIGPMTFVCSACNALMFQTEKHNKAQAFSLCCSYGKIIIPGITPPLNELQKLYANNDEESKEFRKKNPNVQFSPGFVICWYRLG